jgi:hypothetical protein
MRMKTEIKTTTKVTLSLTEEEARWLKSTMQNPLYGEHPADESDENKEMRERFWVALNHIGDL